MQRVGISAEEALKRLKAGNERYLNATKGGGNVGPALRRESYIKGQSPYAVVISCSDSRVIPEAIFSAGIGELFVIRVAGNVPGDFGMGSVEYAVEHLQTKLVLVLGHTGCGAVAAAGGAHGGYLQRITDEIRRNIGGESDPVKASLLNVKRTVHGLEGRFGEEVLVAGALYHTDSGLVEFL